jgi:Protein of unknown function (DUF3168)
MIPDGERILSDYLRDHPDVVAEDTRIVGKTPPEGQRATSWARVTQLDAPTRSAPVDHLIEFYFQIDVYAGATGGQPEASRLARTIRAAIDELNGMNYQDDGAVITGAQASTGPRALDDGLAPARDLFRISVSMWAHATAVAS